MAILIDFKIKPEMQLMGIQSFTLMLMAESNYLTISNQYMLSGSYQCMSRYVT